MKIYGIDRRRLKKILKKTMIIVTAPNLLYDKLVKDIKCNKFKFYIIGKKIIIQHKVIRQTVNKSYIERCLSYIKS